MVGDDPNALVFPAAKGGPMRRSGFNRAPVWPEAVRAIGVPNLHFHDLRHTGNMFAAASGVGLKDLMARMGHDNIRAAMIYQHAVRGVDQAITDAIDRHIAGPDQEDPPTIPIARKITRPQEQRKPSLRIIALSWAFNMRAGDGNRTRAVSLGTGY
ncbi:tyrosine-type recombinase/integrase [Nonomuraea sp. NPDC050310]|uniref:tyrosine-type recombinase/integrase n=1 Tax=Nonomuraea sp. NPDC050310 TaxID=3154935 RepID=UPI003403474C